MSDSVVFTYTADLKRKSVYPKFELLRKYIFIFLHFLHLNYYFKYNLIFFKLLLELDIQSLSNNYFYTSLIIFTFILIVWDIPHISLV